MLAVALERTNLAPALERTHLAPALPRPSLAREPHVRTSRLGLMPERHALRGRHL